MTPPTAPTPDPLSTVACHLSTYSPSGSASCVEAGPLRGGTPRVAVRHSHHTAGTIQVYPAPAWTTFLTAVKTGDFDLPAV